MEDGVGKNWSLGTRRIEEAVVAVVGTPPSLAQTEDCHSPLSPRVVTVLVMMTIAKYFRMEVLSLAQEFAPRWHEAEGGRDCYCGLARWETAARKSMVTMSPSRIGQSMVVPKKEGEEEEVHRRLHVACS